MTITLQAVNELIQSLESAGELSIKETKVMALAKAYQQLAAERDAALNAERVWERAMMEVCGEDGPTSVANEIRSLRALRDTALTELRAQVEQLAAENMGLKNVFGPGDAVLNFLTIALRHTTYDQIDLDDVTLAFKMSLPETPATDRIVAGIKADGVEWTEGAEPSEFGRYWVRYETDVGPQYCSAKWMEYNFCASSDTNIHKIWLADHSRSINSLKGVTHYTKLPASLEDQQLRDGGNGE